MFVTMFMKIQPSSQTTRVIINKTNDNRGDKVVEKDFSLGLSF